MPEAFQTTPLNARQQFLATLQYDLENCLSIEHFTAHPSSEFFHKRKIKRHRLWVPKMTELEDTGLSGRKFQLATIIFEQVKCKSRSFFAALPEK